MIFITNEKSCWKKLDHLVDQLVSGLVKQQETADGAIGSVLSDATGKEQH